MGQDNDNCHTWSICYLFYIKWTCFFSSSLEDCNPSIENPPNISWTVLSSPNHNKQSKTKQDPKVCRHQYGPYKGKILCLVKVNKNNFSGICLKIQRVHRFDRSSCMICPALFALYGKFKPADSSFKRTVRDAFNMCNKSTLITWLSTVNISPAAEANRLYLLQYIRLIVSTVEQQKPSGKIGTQ